MGITSKQFDALAADTSKRYFLRVNDTDDTSWDLVDRTTGEVVWNDAMQPEDANLVRDLFWIVDALNDRDSELAKLRAIVRDACALVSDMQDLTEYSKRWLHDSTQWDADESLGPQWREIERRAGELAVQARKECGL